MGIITTSADRSRGQECGEFTKNSNSKSKKIRRRQLQKMTPIQRLFDACSEVFVNSGTDIVPTSQDIEKLRTVLDDIQPADVGLTPNMPYFCASKAEPTPAITYLHLYECERFSMGIFCLPPSGVIPLHNHPGMTVFSKLLFGTMHIKSYDWVVDASNTPLPVDPPQREMSGARLAQVKVDSTFTAPCETSILYPADGGNMHCFTAVTACAVLDVLGPPYSDPDGRHCNYYFNYPVEEEREGYAWLQERDRPKELAVVGAPYRGPSFMERGR